MKTDTVFTTRELAAMNHINDVINERLPKQQEEKLIDALSELSALLMAVKLAKTVFVSVGAQ